MNKITEITRRDIYELFLNGIDSESPFDSINYKYQYNGRISEIEFLERIYQLEKIASTDLRFNNAKEEIKYHTIQNDYPEGWIFLDKRFGLKDGDDKLYLDFLCQIFHPYNRIEDSYWETFLEKINIFLRNDGYEIYTHENISNKPVYTWREYNASDYIFIPFSERYKKEIRQKSIKISIPLSTRKQIYNTLNKYDFPYSDTDENGWEQNRWFSEDAFDRLRIFYEIRCFNKSKQYVITNNLEDFVCNNYPEKVLDIIEAFYYIPGKMYIQEMNLILKQYKIPFILNNEAKLEYKLDIRLNHETVENIEEVGIQELLQTAQSFFDQGNKVIAVEKIWDAFERLKSYYEPTLDKKKSVDNIIKKISHGNSFFEDKFNKEFVELTNLGNNLRIRHHEICKQEIIDSQYYDYLYQRCLALIMLASKYI